MARKVKNVILMISDGWGYNQVLATDYFTDGQAGSQIYERFPTKVAMSTYSFGDITTDDDADSVYTAGLWQSFDLFKKNPTDSAAAGTAMSTGIKTYDAAIGVDQELEDLDTLRMILKAWDVQRVSSLLWNSVMPRPASLSHTM